MRTKHHQRHYPNYPIRIRGFSLIEFLVASMLSMIVLIAAGSGYFAARKLNDVTLGRLQVQQDLRVASNMLVRDARMAGSFGCFNLSGIATGDTHINGSDTGNSPLNLINNASGIQNTGIKELNANIITGANFAHFQPLANSKALLFQYGSGSATVDSYSTSGVKFFTVENSELAATNSATPLVVSSCKILDRLTGASINNSAGTVTVSGASLSVDHVKGQIMALRYVANIYLVGRPQGVPATEPAGFYRFQLNENGAWSGPQLLLNKVNSMDLRYGYVENCPTSGAVNTISDEFHFYNEIQKGQSVKTPAILQVVLNGGNIEATGRSAVATDAAAGDVTAYDIYATIRGGNSCADRSI